MTKRNEHEADRKHRERLEKITAASHAALAEPNDDPAAAGFSAAKRDNRLAAMSEDRGEAIATRLDEGSRGMPFSFIGLNTQDKDDLEAYLRCGRQNRR